MRDIFDINHIRWEIYQSVSQSVCVWLYLSFVSSWSSRARDVDLI